LGGKGGLVYKANAEGVGYVYTIGVVEYHGEIRKEIGGLMIKERLPVSRKKGNLVKKPTCFDGEEWGTATITEHLGKQGSIHR